MSRNRKLVPIPGDVVSLAGTPPLPEALIGQWVTVVRVEYDGQLLGTVRVAWGDPVATCDMSLSVDGMRAWLPIDREDTHIVVRPPCFLGCPIHRPHRYAKQKRGRDIYLVHAGALA